MENLISTSLYCQCILNITSLCYSNFLFQTHTTAGLWTPLFSCPGYHSAWVPTGFMGAQLDSFSPSAYTFMHFSFFLMLIFDATEPDSVPRCTVFNYEEINANLWLLGPFSQDIKSSSIYLVSWIVFRESCNQYSWSRFQDDNDSPTCPTLSPHPSLLPWKLHSLLK